MYIEAKIVQLLRTISSYTVVTYFPSEVLDCRICVNNSVMYKKERILIRTSHF